MIAVHEILPIVYFLLVGWLVLWPLRNRLGAGWYHLAAIPIGLLGGPVAGAISTVTGRPLDMVSACAGAFVLAAIAWLVARFVAAPGPGDAFPVRGHSYAVAGGIAVVLGGVLGLSRVVMMGNDSFMSYWPMGLALSWNGAFTARLMGTRAPLITTMNAIQANFGSDFAFAIYPLLGATVLGAVGLSIWRGPLSGAAEKTRKIVTAVTLGFLVLEPSFIFNSFFVHTHMISALYLLLAGLGLWFALPRASESDNGTNDAFLLLAGFAAAGLALARPDGLAYMFIPVAVALSILTIGRVRWRSVLSFFIPMVSVVASTYAAAFAKLGLWHDSKLSGRVSLAILSVLLLASVTPGIVQWLDRRLPFRVRGENFLGILVGTSVAGVVLVLALKWDTAHGALATARINLFQGEGGYFYLWWAVVTIFVLTLISGDALRLGSWTRSPFLAILLFFVIAALVHGLSHEGRLGAGDSFNRVAFEIIPLIVWFVAAVIARIVVPSEAEPPAFSSVEGPLG